MLLCVFKKEKSLDPQTMTVFKKTVG